MQPKYNVCIGLMILSMQSYTCFAESPKSARATTSETMSNFVVRGRGADEQPRILNIIPWQKPQDSAKLDQISQEMLKDERLLKPLYREEFIREVEFYKDFQP